MKIRRCALWLIFSAASHIFAAAAAAQELKLAVIPITYMEKSGANFVQKAYPRDITADIAGRIDRFYDVRIDRTPLNDSLAGATTADARRVANYYPVEYVLYGAVKNDGSALFAELRIYNRRNENHEPIVAGDTANNYERLINTLNRNIQDWFRVDEDKVDVLRHEIRDLREEVASVRGGLREEAAPGKDSIENNPIEKKPREETEKEFALRVPVSLGYWSYTERMWAETVQGTVEFAAGIEMHPELQFPALFGMKNEMSLGLRIGYRNGVTGLRDNVIMNGIIVNPSAGYHVNLYTRNWLCIGAGIFYEHSLWEIAEREYNAARSYQQSLTGYTVTFDYAYRLNRMFTINFGTNIYGYFTLGSSPVIRTYLGTVITVFGGR